jgi:uncharacterized protein YcfJ
MNTFPRLSAFLAGTLLVLSTAAVSAPSPSPQDYNGNYSSPTRDDYRRYPGNGRLVCRTEQVRHVQSRDNNKIAGTAIGAVAGGLLGNQIGHGRGNTLATVGGAVAGGYAGRKIQENHQDKNAYYTTERRCWRE